MENRQSQPDRAAPVARGSAIWLDALNLLAGIVLVASGGADRLWHAVQTPVSWRTGPLADATLSYLILLALGWLVFNAIVTRARIGCGVRMERLILRAMRFVVAGAVLIAIQVLALSIWPLVAAAVLLAVMLVGDRSEGVGRRLIAWAWIAAGIALSGLLIHPWFQGQPMFIPRLATILTAWRMLGLLLPWRLREIEPWTPDWLG